MLERSFAPAYRRMLVGFAIWKAAIDGLNDHMAIDHVVEDDARADMEQTRPSTSQAGVADRRTVVCVPEPEQFRCPETSFVPGTQGSDAQRERELRTFCHRLYGYSLGTEDLVEEMMDSLLTAARQGTPIALRGSSDLVPVAHALHRRLFGSDAPFVVCDPRRREVDGTVRSAPNRRSGREALAAAVGGSVCIRAHRLPWDFQALAASFRQAGSLAMLFVCLRDSDQLRDALCPPVRIPSIAECEPDLDRLLNECFLEAAAELEVRRVRLASRHRQDILRDAESVPDLEKTALRIVALASSRTVGYAAAKLNMASISLTRWMRRRSWLAGVLCKPTDLRQNKDTDVGEGSGDEAADGNRLEWVDR